MATKKKVTKGCLWKLLSFISLRETTKCRFIDGDSDT